MLGKVLFGAGVLTGPAMVHGGGDKTSGDSTNNTKVNTVTTSYTIQDNDKYNVYSMNIYDGKGSDGPIFQIVAGQTSCPFEREKELNNRGAPLLFGLLDKNVSIVTCRTNQNYKRQTP